MDQLHPTRASWRRLTPRAGTRSQLIAAAALWGVGTAILLSRGTFYMFAQEELDRWGLGVAFIGLAAIAIGVAKAHLVLIRYARKAVSRILTRGHACFFGFFAPSSWLFILVMMGGGMLLRRTPLVDYLWGRTFLGILYVAVGTALLIADIVFWRAVFRPAAATAPVRRDEAPPA